MSKIEIKDLYLIFGNEKQKALKMLKEDKSKSEILKDTGCTVGVKNANISINEGEFFVIMGLSGSGKSTLLRCINRLIRPTSGQVLVNGIDISKVSEKELLQVRRKELAMVFQNFGLLPHRSVLHNIAFGLELQGVKKEEREKKAMESMKLVGLKGYENQMVGELSEKQKALKMLKEDKSKSEILKDTGCTVGVKNANISINEGEFFVIMGLSGSGKSTLLRCINRLIRPTSGQVLVNGIDISKVSEKELLQVRRKELAMVFQNFGLLPHRSVLHNIAFGLELQGVKKEEREKKAMESMKLVGLKGYENQMVGELSGGMQQRVGLARALANNPEVLLMDEAFSALDPLIRVQMQDELLALQSKMKKTIVFITHDLSEAIKLGDRIAIMKDGEVVQIGTSEEILTEPANDYVARFVENVDRSKIITASSLMIDKPLVARLKKEGPEVLIRKMRAKNITVLPVIDADDKLVGEVRLNDLLKLRNKQEKSIETVVRTEVHSVLCDTVLEDILPLMTKSNSPVWVIDETREFLGTIPLSSLIIEVTGKDKEEINEIIQNAIDL